MIKLNRPSAAPKVLVEHEAEWTQELMNEIAKHGSYEKIPKKLKDKILSKYAHEDIKKALFDSSNEKCAFCESKPAESGNIEIEHFAPKSIYPERTFQWNNFLPSCRKCNQHKKIHDTLLEPILNPYNHDPEDALIYDFLKIKAKKESLLFDKAELTIKVCKLNHGGLIEGRSKYLVILTGYIQELESKILEIETADTKRKRRNRLESLRDSLYYVQRLTFPEGKYSGYCKFYLSSQEAYIKAVKLIKELDSIED